MQNEAPIRFYSELITIRAKKIKALEIDAIITDRSLAYLRRKQAEDIRKLEAAKAKNH